MRVPGAPDPAYVRARRVLLDALSALAQQRDAVILVGAQAIYLDTGEFELAVAEYTIDGDIVLDPGLLSPAPELSRVMRGAGFDAVPGQPGAWTKKASLMEQAEVVIDLMVPATLGGPGRRAARLGPTKE